ncbi:Metaxin-2 [Mortierella sp. NVP85]|nr:Metaxin-2 [Mortierella sp. NVP85]
MTDRKEEVIPVDEVVEFFEETQPDGSVVRKKKIIRKSKRVITTTSSQPVSEGERVTTTTTTSASNTTHQGPDTEITHGSKGRKEQEEQGAQRDIVEDASGTTKASEEKGAVVGHIHHPSGVAEDSSSSAATTTGRTFKYRVFGEGDVSEHPFYRFLAMFPLKQLPAPHTRPHPVKAIIYAYVPGWHAGQTTPAAPSKSAIGSFDTYLKFNQIEFEVKPAFEPNMSPSGKLPFLALSNGSFVTAEGFEEWVQENKSKSAGVKLDHHEAAEALAFINLAESKIHAALLYTLWFDPAHFPTTTRQHYFGHHNRLLALLLSYVERSRVSHSMLLSRSQIDRELIFEEAATAIESLAVQLGQDNEYFFGKSAPSSLDAVVFSYLHVILTLPKIKTAEDAGRSGELARIVKKHENLYKYSQAIWAKWFSQ